MNQPSENNEGDLLIWGYACKLFRDDEKAVHIDLGKHLIPWMGDDKLMIDRYDGRGALYDLTSCEPVEGSWDDLSYEEAEIEKKCDKERYMYLYHNEEHDIYREEEEKRNQSKYGQVAYSYEEGVGGGIIGCEPQGAASPPAPVLAPPPPQPKGRLYSPPVGLDLPQELVLPDTMKQHAIIVKTAAFIAQQGSQMEILMRLKQNGNKQFDFLSHGDPLHNYYRHLLTCLKSGTYVPSEQDTSCLEDDEPEEDDHYLHPSLVPAPPAPPQPPDPSNPPPLVKEIINKMVKYISKNGLIFEEAIRKRNDQRFSFLDSSDLYYNYYREKVTTAFRMGDTILKDKIENLNPEVNETKETVGPKKKRKPTPVCFSIKKAKDNEGLEVASALPVEDSTEDEEQENDSGKESDSQTDTQSKPRGSKSRDKNQPKDVDLQKERKLKVAQFLQGLRNK